MGSNTSRQILGMKPIQDQSIWSDQKPTSSLINYLDDHQESNFDVQMNGNFSDNFSYGYSLDGDGIEMKRTTGELVVGTLTFVAITLMTIGGNILVILSVLTYRPLTRVQNYFLVSLAVADLAVAVFVTPFHVVKFIVGEWIFGLAFCQIWLTADILCCTASILNLCAIALDRYWAIHDPIAYASKRTLKLVLFMISAVWVLSILISVPPLIGWNDWRKERLNTTCELTTQREFVVYSASGSFFIPLLVMATVYAKIFLAARHRLRSKRRSVRGLSIGSIPESEPGDRELRRDNSRRISQRNRPTSAPAMEGNSKTVLTTRTSISAATSMDYSLFTAPSTTTTTNNYGDGDKVPVLTRRNTGLLSTVEEQQCSSNSAYDFGTLLGYGSPSITTPIHPTSSSFTTFPAPRTNDRNSVEKSHLLKNGFTTTDGKNLVKSDKALDNGMKPRRQQSLHHFVHRLSERSSIHKAKYRRSEPYVLGIPSRNESVRTSVSSHVAVERYIKEKERISVTREKKAAKTLAVIMGVFVLCWLPFFIMYVVKPFLAPKRWRMHPKVEEAITWLGYINSAINPVIYTIFNMDFRRAFQTFLCPFRSKKTSSIAVTKTATSGKTC